MRLHSRSARLSLLTLALAAGTIACAQGDDASTTNREAGGTLDTTTPAPALRVAEVELGRSLEADKQIKDNTDDFAVRDTIYASVKTEGAANGATLTARWTFGDSATVVETQNQTVNSTGGDAYTEFHIMKATAWPKGNYKLTVLLNGVEASTKEFEVK